MKKKQLNLTSGLPGTFFPGKNGRTGKHGAFPWKR